MTPDGTAVWAAVTQGLQEINPADNIIRRTVLMPARAYSIAISRDGQFVYTALQRTGFVAEFDVRRDTVTRQSDGRQVYIAASNDPKIYVADVREHTIVGTINLKLPAVNIAFSADGKRAYAHGEDNKLTVIDTATPVFHQVPLPADNSAGIALSPDGKRVYVLDQDRNRLLVAAL